MFLLVLPEDSTEVTLPNHGVFEIVEHSVGRHETVSVRTSAGIPLFSRRILAPSMDGAFECRASDIELGEYAGGIWIRVDEAEAVRISDAELSLLRWFGPASVYAGKLGPLWHWWTALDALVVALIALALFQLSGTDRSRLRVRWTFAGSGLGAIVGIMIAMANSDAVSTLGTPSVIAGVMLGLPLGFGIGGFLGAALGLLVDRMKGMCELDHAPGP